MSNSSNNPTSIYSGGSVIQRSCPSELPDVVGRGLGRRGIATLIGAGALFSSALTGQAKAQEIGSGRLAPLPPGTLHTLPSNSQTVQPGAMDPAVPSVLTINSGDIVYYPNTWLNWGNQPKYGMTFAQLGPIRKQFPGGPFSLIGPITMRGAEPGDVIECRMLRLRPTSWGWNSAPKGVGALPSDFHEPYIHYFRFNERRTATDFGKGVTIPLAPVQGFMATQPAGVDSVSSILVGPNGGMVALREITVGTSLFLPVAVEGARIWTGGSWAAVGDGMVDNVAIETAMEDLRIQYVLHKRVALDGPIAETPDSWIVLGDGPDLESALTAALRRAIAWLSAATPLSPQDVYALCSIAGSFRVSQYANQLHTVYKSKQGQAMYVSIPKNVFDGTLLNGISQSLRPVA